MAEPTADPFAVFRLVRPSWSRLCAIFRSAPLRTVRALAGRLMRRRSLRLNGRRIAGPPLEIAQQLHSLEALLPVPARAAAGLTVRTIVDAGANLGLFSVLAAGCRPQARIVALEPNPAIRSECGVNLAALPRAELRPIALAAAAGPVRLYAAPSGPDQGATLRPEFRRRDQTAEHVVPAAAFAEPAAELGRIDVLKLDIEGAERALVGELCAAADRIGVLFIELHYPPEAAHETAHDLGRLAEAFPPAHADRYTLGKGKYYATMVGRSREAPGDAGRGPPV
jgi:FkbM family methyltransferase